MYMYRYLSDEWSDFKNLTRYALLIEDDMQETKSNFATLQT